MRKQGGNNRLLITSSFFPISNPGERILRHYLLD